MGSVGWACAAWAAAATGLEIESTRLDASDGFIEDVVNPPCDDDVVC
jgi:hypothetical protein